MVITFNIFLAPHSFISERYVLELQAALWGVLLILQFIGFEMR